MKPLSQLVRPNIQALQPYSTARDEYAGGGIDVWLDANESPYDNGVNRYPDPHQRALKALIAELKGVDAGRIFIGNGSDEAIDLAFRIFCRPGLDNAVSIAPTYGMYRVAAATNDVQMREVPLGAGYSLPVGALLAAADERTKLMWLCSPNNPTGNAFPAQEIESLLRRFDGIVVLDEATAFADPENEVLVQKAFAELGRDKTVVMIAHRLTAVKNADMIFVLKDGRIEESGTHDALLEHKKLYAKMWKDYVTSVSWKVTEARRPAGQKGGNA